MAKVKVVKVEISFKKNIGNYESLMVSAGAELVLEEKDKVATVYKQAYDMCSNEIMEQLKEFESSKGKK
jgi:hypothetical protein